MRYLPINFINGYAAYRQASCANCYCTAARCLQFHFLQTASPLSCPITTALSSSHSHAPVRTGGADDVTWRPNGRGYSWEGYLARK